jgi:hypothetical protein
MSVTKGHKIIHILPTPADQETPHRIIYLHLDEPYDPPTYVNNVLFQRSNRPNVLTPSAFTWHLRYACKSLPVLQHTQQHVEGLHIRQGSFEDLKALLPCTTCLAGKMRKSKSPPTKRFTDIENLATSLTNAPLSWSPYTADKQVNPNYSIAVDWGIINKKHKTGVNNVFALFLI